MYEIKLGLQALIRNRKRTFTMTGILVLLISFVVLINVLMYTNRANQDVQREMLYGSWSHAFIDESKSELFDTVGTYDKITDNVGSFDKNMLELANFEYYRGRKPQNEHEVILTLDALNTLGIDYELDQSISIDNIQFKLVGIIFPYDVDWIRSDEFQYPRMITTHRTSSDSVYFGKASKLTPFFTFEDVIAVNTYAYPYIDATGEMFQKRNEETATMDVQSLKLTQFLLLAMLVVLAVVLGRNAEFYQKRLEIFAHHGMTRWGMIRYILPQLIFYVALIPFLFYVIPNVIELVLLPIRYVRYDNNVDNLTYACLRAMAMIAVLFVVSFMFGGFNFQQNLKLKVFQSALLFIVSFITVYMVTPQTIILFEERIPQWKTYEKIWESSMYYLANGSLGGVSQEQNPFSQYNAEWSLEDIEGLIHHPKTKYVHYLNIRYVQYPIEDHSQVTASIRYYDDTMWNLFELPFNVSDDFTSGNSFYVQGENTQGFEEGEVIYFNEVPFTYERNFTLDHTDVTGFSYNGIVFSEAGAKRLNLPTDTFNFFVVSVEKMSDFFEYDALVRRVAGNSYFTNVRLSVEREVNKEKSLTIFMALEIFIQYSLGLAILALLCLQRLMTKRKTLAIYHFLGESKTKMVLKHSLLYVVPVLIVILPSILFAVNMKIQTSSLVFSSMIGLTFVFILWVVCLLIHISYLRGSLLDLLDERE